VSCYREPIFRGKHIYIDSAVHQSKSLKILEYTSKLVKEEILNGSLKMIKDILQSLCK